MTIRQGIAASLLWASCLGCGDATGDPASDLEALDMSGLDARLSRHSTACTQRGYDELIAVVGSNVEFPAEDVATLDPPCPTSPTPSVDVYFVGNSLVFDFGALQQAVSFPAASVDTVRVALARSCGDPVIARAAVDARASTVEMPAYRIESAVDRIDVNLAGMQFDSSSFLKIDLEVLEIECGNV